MTRKEAIEILKDLWRTKYSTYLETDIRKALDMAIKALEQEPYDDAKYHEEHGEVIVDKAVWEDAKRALEQEPITKITRKYCVQDESGYTDEELVGKVNEIIDYINKEPRQDLQQAAERIIEQQNKWFEEQERKEQEPAYCDRNICIKNEYNNIGCEECEVTKSQEPTCDTCEYNTATFNPCNACKDKSEYKPQEISYAIEQDLNKYTGNIEIIEKKY